MEAEGKRVFSCYIFALGESHKVPGSEDATFGPVGFDESKGR